MKNFTILSSGTAVSYKYFLDAVIIKACHFNKTIDEQMAVPHEFIYN